MRAASDKGLPAVRSIAQMVCSADICLVVLVSTLKVADFGKVRVNPVPEVSF
jgi:hypothetical protein